MRILVATDNRFWRRSIGSQVRIAALIDHWVRQGHVVHVLFAGSVTEADTHALRGLPVASARASGAVLGSQPAAARESGRLAPRRERVVSAIRNRFRDAVRIGGMCVRALAPAPMEPSVRFRYRWQIALREPTLRDHLRPEAQRLFVELFRTHEPDVVVVEYVRMSYVLDALGPTERVRTPCIVDTHDVISERRARMHEHGHASDLALGPAQEALLLARFDAAIAIQARDAQTLRRLCPRTPVLVAGHPVNLARCRERARAPVLRCLFLGSGMAPNVDAANRLMCQIWPLVLQGAGTRRCELSIAGSVCDKLAGIPIPPHVRLLGEVPSVEDVFSSHDAFVSPIAMGGGLKIKNVEALSAGLALVTSPQGAEGMQDAAGTAFVVADSAHAFADAIIGWSRDEALLAQYQRAGELYADEHFGPQAAYGELDRWLVARAPARN
jgi:glycosyltransferase involved in cell wall biosynthesis